MIKTGAISDLCIWVAYMVMGITFGIISWRTKLGGLGMMFGCFIFSCGITHVNTFWAVSHGRCDADWRWAVGWKLACALFSVPTAVFLIHAVKDFKKEN